MKKTLAGFATLLITLTVSGQVEVGIFAGPQATSTKYLVFNQNQKSDFKYGFQAGATMKVYFDKNLFFAPAFFYSIKGYKVVFKDFVYPPDSSAIDNNTTIHTVELAAMLQYDLGKNPGHAFIKAGPALDFHLTGTEEFNLKSGGSVSRKMPFGYGSDYGHFSANLLMQFGYETNSGFFIFGQYTHGLASTNNSDGGPRIYHRAYGISIGKYLNRKKIVIDTRNKE